MSTAADITLEAALRDTLAALDDFFEMERAEGFAPRHRTAWMRVTDAYDAGHAALARKARPAAASDPAREALRWLLALVTVEHSPFVHDYVRDERRCKRCAMIVKARAALAITEES